MFRPLRLAPKAVIRAAAGRSRQYRPEERRSLTCPACSARVLARFSRHASINTTNYTRRDSAPTLLAAKKREGM